MSQSTDSSMDTASEADSLFARARKGDQRAWKELFETCYPKVLRAIRRRLKSQTMRSLYDSTDFVSDVWKSLAEDPSRFNFPTVEELQAFLYKAAERKIIDQHRRLHTLKNDVTRDRRLGARLDQSHAAPDLPSDYPTASKFVQADELREQLLSLSRSPEGRRAVELKQLGHSNQDIAQETGWSPRKVQRFFKELADSWNFEQPGGER